MPDAEVVNIFTGAPVAPQHTTGTVDQTLVKTLDTLLTMAKAGQLQSIIGVGFTDDNRRLTFFSLPEFENASEILGAVEWLKIEYINRVMGKIGGPI
jgi:hypothetical protein